MEVKLYCGNMSYDTTEEQLRTLFSEAGSVVAVDVIKDRDTGTAKGFAFITTAKPREERSGGGGRSSYNSGNRGGSNRRY